jgi:hypothetical protein
MASSGQDVRYVQAVGAVGAPVADQFVVLAPDMEYVRLDPTGRVIWEALGRPATVDDVAAALCARYDVDPDVARADAVAYLAKLDRLGLVSVATG